MLPEEKYKELKEELDNCQNPLFFYDDDPDGLCSFLILYRYKKEGNGVFVKSVPKLDVPFLHQVDKYNPDKIFILDMPMVSDDFFDSVKVPVVWVDHHPHDAPQHVKHFNPHMYGYKKGDSSTTALAYNTVKQDLWIAAVGAIADWTIPSYIDNFIQKYPNLLTKEYDTPPKAMFDSPLSKIISIFGMVLKGDTKNVKKCIKALSKINDPEDLLEERSEEAKFIARKIKSAMEEYEKLIERAMAVKNENGIISFIHKVERFSFSKEISNYLQHKNPKSVIIVGRVRNGEYKLSLRAQDLSLPPILEKALVGINGYGGGHEHACGACIKEENFCEFLERLKEGIEEAGKSL